MTTHKTAPFDLEKALAGAPVVTRNGIQITEIFYAKTAHEGSKIIAIINSNAILYFENGMYDLRKDETVSFNWCDLFMLIEPIKK